MSWTNQRSRCDIKLSDIEGCIDHIYLEETEDTVIVDDDFLTELLYICKDQGGTTSSVEEQELTETSVSAVQPTCATTTRSGRLRKRKALSHYVIY